MLQNTNTRNFHCLELALVALKLHNQNSIASLLQIFIMTDQFRKDRSQYNPSVTLNLWACKGLEAIYRSGYQYKKAGVILGGNNPQIRFSD